MQLSPPPKDDTVIWKYMPVENFYRLLDAKPAIDDWAALPNAFSEAIICLPSLGSLWLCLPMGFKDKYEGTFPALNCSKITYCKNAAVSLGVLHSDTEQRYQSFSARQPAELRERVRATANLHGVSCWHAEVDESRKMWKKYGQGDDGVGRCVAIRTTCKKLRDAVALPSLDIPASDENTRLTVNCPNIAFDRFLLDIATVTYVNLNKDFLLRDGSRNLLRLKRRDKYVDDKEVRCIGVSPALTCLYRRKLLSSVPSLYELRGALNSVSTTRQGYCLPVDLARMVEEIRTCPGADATFLEHISSRVVAKGLSASLVRPSVFLGD